jgi:3-hydroxy-9,10-secoandrosta-1,3,5(10)-triene-9,17-dione monooxygenase reductase component
MAIDPVLYRTVLGHYPTGVTVVAAVVDDEPVGLTIGSFTSVSLDPPLVGFLPMINSDRWGRMRASGSFAVSVLAADQSDVCWRFAKSSIDQPFDGVAWTPAAKTGSPVLDGSIAWMDCTLHGVVDAGDHHFVMGEILDCGAAPTDSSPRPLLFFRGGLGDFHSL